MRMITGERHTESIVYYFFFRQIDISLLSVYLSPHGFASSAVAVYMCNWLICQG